MISWFKQCWQNKEYDRYNSRIFIKSVSGIESGSVEDGCYSNKSPD